MSFDWVRFLQAHHIEYVEQGKNLSRGNLGIRCPFCGDDPEYHMGISLYGHGWNCWRDRTHKGRSPVGLIQVLLKCTWEQAREHAGMDKAFVPEDWCSQTLALLEPPPPPKRKPLKLPTEFLNFTGTSKERPFLTYLATRGFTLLDAQQHNLHYALSGPFRYRVIFPVRFGGHLVSWTGRTINGAEPRYKAHTIDPELAEYYGYSPAIGPVNNYLLWYDHLALHTGVHTLVICEGPMDALRVSVLGARDGITATALFGAEPTGAQIELLHSIADRFENRAVLLDRGAESKTMQVSRSLRSLDVGARFMIPGRKDPGELRDLKELKACLRGMR